MHRDIMDTNSNTKRGFKHAANLTVVVISLFFSGQALAVKAGHGRVNSSPGQALQISLPLLELNAQDQAALQVKVAPAAEWSKAGLTPPVALDGLTVVLKPGLTAASREVVITSNQQTTISPVDILLDVTTATGAMQIQSSYLVLLPAQLANAVQVAGASSLRVRPGDTLFAIAQRYTVADTDMYQMLLAIFNANPKAFIARNMNLLRVGVVLNIPDAQTIRSIDKDLARKTYEQHLTAFNSRRTAANARNTPSVISAATPKSIVTPSASPEVTPPVSPEATPEKVDQLKLSAENTPLVTGADTQSGIVTPPATPETTVEKTDHLKLSAANTADQSEDAKVSAAKEADELQSRIQALQQNVKQLKESVAETGVENSTASPLPLSALASQALPTTKPVDPVASGGLTPVAPVAPITSSAKTADEQTSSALSVATKDTSANASKEASKNVWNDVVGFLAQNILATLTAVIALSALVIAWMFRRAGARRDDEAEDQDAAFETSPEVQTAFDKKLQTISLDLNNDPASVNKAAPSIRKPV